MNRLESLLNNMSKKQEKLELEIFNLRNEIKEFAEYLGIKLEND